MAPVTPRSTCDVCKTLTPYAPDGLDIGRTKPTRRQVFAPATIEGHECEYILCDECDVKACECDARTCESCSAALCDDCYLPTDDGPPCEDCCMAGYNYRSVSGLVENNHRLRVALRACRDALATSSTQDDDERAALAKADEVLA